MTKNFKLKLNADNKPEEDIVSIDIKNREKIAKEVAQNQEEFEAIPEKKEKKSIDDIFAFDGEGLNIENYEVGECSGYKPIAPDDDSYEERRRNAVAGLADAIADISSALIVVASLVDTVLIKED